MSDDRAVLVMRRWSRLKGDRGQLETQWQTIAELVRPLRADFTTMKTPGQNRALQVFDATPGVAAENLAAGLWSMVTNSANEWFRLRHPDEALQRRGDVQRWLDVVSAIMRDAFAAGGQRFYAEALALYGDLVTFGTGLFYVAESAEPGRLFFSNRALTECVIGQDDEERVDCVIRRFEWSAHQAFERWGEAAGEAVRGAMDARQEDKKFWFLHAVEPNPAFRPGRRREKRYRSLHVSETDMAVIQAGGFDDFPYMVPRWSTATRGLYGDSPASLALPDIKTLQAQEKTMLVASQRAADPPLLAADENAMRSIRVTPGGITYGAVDANGNPLVRPLESRGAFQLTEAMTQQKRDAVRTAFYGALLTMMATPGATATEVLARQEEQLRMMGPHLGRLQSEFHDPLISRVFGLLWRAGAFPPPPDVLADAPEIAVEYVSPLARAQKASEGQAILRTLEAVLPLAQADPGILENLEFDEVARGLADAFGLPARMIRDAATVAQLRDAAKAAAAEQQQRATVAAAAQPFAQAAKGARDLAAAEAQAAATDGGRA